MANDVSAARLAVLTTMNTVCGIAEYSRDLYASLIPEFTSVTFIANRDVADRTRADADNVARLWEYGEREFTDVIAWISEQQPDYFHIQLHSENHFPLSGLSNLLQGIRELAKPPKIIITPHSVVNTSFDLAAVKDLLAKVDKILVHKQKDFDYLSSQGLTNLELFPHPFDVYPLHEKTELRKKLGIIGEPVIVTHGLISHHKGLLEILQAVNILKTKHPHILWLAVNALNINNTTSAGTLELINEKITELDLSANVLQFTDFLSAAEVLLLMQAADIGICAYSEVGESASAAVRKHLASGVPTIVTDIPMMQELDDEVIRIADNQPQTIATGIEELLLNPPLMTAVSKRALEISGAHSWKVMAQKLVEIYSSL